MKASNDRVMNGRRQNKPFPLTLAVAGAAAAGLYTIAHEVRRQRRADFTARNVLISGASRGLGLELARAFAEENSNLMLLARDDEELARAKREFETRGKHVLTAICDVANERDVRAAVTRLAGELGRIDVLINNAGVIQVGPVEHMKTEDYADAMNVHYWGPLYLMQAVIPYMKHQRWGRIVNIASIAGKIAVPHLAPYVASKFALVGLSEAMRAELTREGIYVTTVCPGLMRTGSHLNAFFKGQQRKEFALFSILNASPLFSTSSGTAARQILEACRYGTAELVITPQARLARLFASLFPNTAAEIISMMARLLPGPGPGGDQLESGWQSRSVIAPSFLTENADRAAVENREQSKTAGKS